MRKILFTANSLNIGGIETALVTILNNLDKQNKYDITLVLEKKEGVLLNKLPKGIKVIEYTPNNSKNVVIRKFLNLINRLNFSLKHKNKYDFSASFATYSLPCSYVARKASKNAILWVHNNYLAFLENDVGRYVKFFKDIKASKFKKILFVSNEALKDYVKIFNVNENDCPNLIVCNNLIDSKQILEKANEKTEEIVRIEKLKSENKNLKVFVNIGRHDEKQKKLSRLLKVVKKLSDDGFEFKVLFVGSGPDEDMYREMVSNLGIDKHVEFCGAKQNPYPYYKVSDCVVLTSEFEGYPVVFLESMVFGKPIITTKVSDFEEIDGKYGIVCEKDVEDIYSKMKDFLENGFESSERFNPDEFNEKILKKVEELIEES